MLSENFIYFFTVWGFFVGIIFGLLKSLNAEGLLSYTLLITSFFYLFGHLIIAFYYKTMNIKTYAFPKEAHEKDLDLFVNEIKKREQLIDRAISMTDSLSELNLKDNGGDKK
jgi:hypothetical protein